MHQNSNLYVIDPQLCLSGALTVNAKCLLWWNIFIWHIIQDRKSNGWWWWLSICGVFQTSVALAQFDITIMVELTLKKKPDIIWVCGVFRHLWHYLTQTDWALIASYCLWPWQWCSWCMLRLSHCQVMNKGTCTYRREKRNSKLGIRDSTIGARH